MLTISVWFQGLSSCRLKTFIHLMARLTLHYHNYHKEKLCVHADCVGYVVIKVVQFHAFYQSVVDFGIVWHAYWHSSTWENHQNSQIQTLITIMTRAQFKHRATLIMTVPVHSTFNILFISRFHVNPKLTAKILSSRCAVMSSLALPPC